MNANGVAMGAWRVSLVLAGTVALSACSAAEPMQPSRSGSRLDSQGSYASASPAAPSTMAGAQAPGATADPSEASEGNSHARVGLGTEWGETRQSQVQETAFERASWSEPFALAMIRYNDRDGVEAASSGRRGHMTKGESDLSIAGGTISVALHGDQGISFPAFHSNANGQMDVIGRAGQRYTIVLTNHTGRRVEAVATVDGLDVMNGSAGSFDHRGYLLGPYATLEIDGFRKSESEVAAFRFGAISDSYAAQTGSARDVGVIGVALFREKGDDRIERDDGVANPFPAESHFAQPPPGR